MSDFTFLTKEQCFGDNKLDIIKKRGVRATATDYSMALGGDRNGQYGEYWTRTSAHIDDRYGGLSGIIVSFDESRDRFLFNTRSTGIRPVVPINIIEKEQISNIKKDEDGILEIEYGYYPQKAPAKFLQNILEEKYKDGILEKTGNTYTIETAENMNTRNDFNPLENPEYVYEGKRYVRIEVRNIENGDIGAWLSNNEFYDEGETVWIEVLPVRWIGSRVDGLMITENVLLAGIPFENYGILEDNLFYESGLYKYGDGDEIEETYLKSTVIGKYLDKYLSKEMLQVREIGEQENELETKDNINPYGLDFDEVDEEDIIREAIRANVSVFLHGKPGCGKSDRVKQLDPDFIELNLSHLDPELLDGLAGEKDGKSVHIKPPWLEELEEKCEEEKDKIHILFLEELTNASPVMQAKAYGIALDKKVAGRWKLPENARVVAAGNELEDSLAANEMAEPLYDRFAHVNIETDVDSWLRWAVTPESTYERLNYKKEDKNRPKIHPSIYAYISCNGDEVLRTPYDRENPAPHADPRRWKMASDMLYASNNPETLRAIIGEETTREFVDFCKIPTISLEDVINGNYTEKDLQMDLGRKFATIAGLVQVDEENMPKVREFVRKLGPEMLKKFEVQWVHGDEERLEQLQELEMEEIEGKLKHSKDEAKSAAQSGVLAFERIDGEYQKFLSREKEDKTKD